MDRNHRLLQSNSISSGVKSSVFYVVAWYGWAGDLDDNAEKFELHLPVDYSLEDAKNFIKFWGFKGEILGFSGNPMTFDKTPPWEVWLDQIEQKYGRTFRDGFSVFASLEEAEDFMEYKCS